MQIGGELIEGPVVIACVTAGLLPLAPVARVVNESAPVAPGLAVYVRSGSTRAPDGASVPLPGGVTIS